MRLLTIALALATCLVLVAGPAVAAEEKENLAVLSQQVDALLLLHYLEATPAQLQALIRLSAVTPKAAAREPAEVSDDLRTAFQDLRDALVQGKDPEQIRKLTRALYELREKEDPDLDDEVTITDPVRQAMPRALRLFSVRQVATYLENQPEELPDPTEKILAALEKVGELEDAAWGDYREDLMEEMGWLVGGLDKRKSAIVSGQVDTWLKQIRGMREGDRARRRAELEKSARAIAEQVFPTGVIHNIFEHKLAELLSNPELPNVLTRLTSRKSPGK